MQGSQSLHHPLLQQGWAWCETPKSLPNLIAGTQCSPHSLYLLRGEVNFNFKEIVALKRELSVFSSAFYLVSD